MTNNTKTHKKKIVTKMKNSGNMAYFGKTYICNDLLHA